MTCKSIIRSIIITAYLILLTGCLLFDAPSEAARAAPVPTERSEESIPDFPLEEYGELLEFPDMDFEKFNAAVFRGRHGLLEVEENGNYDFYEYDMDTGEANYVASADFGMVSSGADLYMGNGSYILTGLFPGEGETSYRKIIEVKTNGERKELSSTEIGASEFPFIYLHKLSETQFLATEIDPFESTVKKYDLETGSVSVFLSSSYSMENEAHKTGKVLRDAAVSGNSIYALLLTLDSQECYEIEQYDLEGNYISTLDSSAAKRFFHETPYEIYCIGNYFILYDVNLNTGVYRIDGNSLTEVIAPEENLEVYRGSPRDIYNAEKVKYIFLSSERQNKDNLLFALELATSELKCVRVSAGKQYLYAFLIDAEGNLFLKMAEDFSQRQMNYYYLSAEVLDDIFSDAAVIKRSDDNT